MWKAVLGDSAEDPSTSNHTLSFHVDCGHPFNDGGYFGFNIKLDWIRQPNVLAIIRLWFSGHL